ncbi:hypothetical protein CLAFUW4_04293 [Fulvia fulva]|nr:hypothetical protein CLAFUR4_04279 [Fulvia fulva]WPV13398.1 hypothetical protein CLAFUW4_04293 [Fulvia fulva]
MSIPESGLVLHGVAAKDDASKYVPDPAILVKLDDSLLEDVKTASSRKEDFQFLTGNFPRIRLGKKTFDLTISNETFRHELYSASSEAFGDLSFAGVVGHRAELSLPERKQSLGSDAALAALQNSLASYKQEKEAKAVNISNNVVAVPKHRFEAYHQQKQARRRGLLGSQPASPSLNASKTPNAGIAPTSMPASDAAARTQAMRTPLIHLLAIGPLSRDSILERTRIPKDDLDSVLEKIAKQDQGKWQLLDRAYKDLDVWKFGYGSQEDRDQVVKNAIRSYDRMRIGKDEKLWQMLLPKEDRDKGIILSKLHLGAAPAAGLTPNLAVSPLVHGETAGDSKIASTANTPRLGPSATPKATSGKNEGGALAKRLFSKDPKKQQQQRAKDEAKEKKRKEKDAAASDRESGKPARKKQMTSKTSDPKVKSAEFVRSSSDESEGELRELGSATSSSQPRAAANASRPLPNATAKKTATIMAARFPSSGEASARAKARPSATSTPKSGAATSKVQPTTAIKTTKPIPPGKSTPNGVSASSSQGRSQLSPQKLKHRPTAPSPLGAARPRVASDVSDRGVVGVQRIRQGAETPKGLGITNGFRKRHDTVTSNESHGSNRSERMSGEAKKTTSDKTPRPTVNGTGTPKSHLTNGNSQKLTNGLKRKPADSPSHGNENGPAAKHRKTESSSSQSQKSQSSDSAGSIKRRDSDTSTTSENKYSEDRDLRLSFERGVDLAAVFNKQYPLYTKMYDEQCAMEKRGEVVPLEDRQRFGKMHRRLAQMKREIQSASTREHEGSR